MEKSLYVENLTVNIEGERVLDKVNFSIKRGEKVILAGPNGAGKSTLARVLMGDEKYEVEEGKIYLEGEEISDFEINERAKKGLFVTFQNPVEIPGVTMANFLRTAYNKVKGENLDPSKFKEILDEKLKEVGLDKSLKSRDVNSAFSGGEKKRSEILQLLLLEPEFAILDEIDSGLDVDGVRGINESLEKVVDELSTGIILITHNMELAKKAGADKMVILKNGKVDQEGGIELIEKVSKEGFNFLKE